jgi:hypothetical protein
MADQQTDDSVTTLTVDVLNNITVRVYTDGLVQRNAHETNSHAQEYAQSVATQEGLQ